MTFVISETKAIRLEQVAPLYQANGWSAITKPEALYQALMNSHTLISAWEQDRLVGLGNAISDGYLVVYYPHLLVHPEYQNQGIGQQIMTRMKAHYDGFHMQMLTADAKAVDFFEKMGFSKAGNTQSMWIYQGREH